MVLVLSGNLAFLNWLTALPAVMCFDDAALSIFFSHKQVDRALNAEKNYRWVFVVLSLSLFDFFLLWRFCTLSGWRPTSLSNNYFSLLSKTLQSISDSGAASTSPTSWNKVSIYTRRTVTFLMACLLCVLSYPVVKNVLSPSQVLYTFNTLYCFPFFPIAPALCVCWNHFWTYS